jgi:hypothetical protein
LGGGWVGPFLAHSGELAGAPALVRTWRLTGTNQPSRRVANRSRLSNSGECPHDRWVPKSSTMTEAVQHQIAICYLLLKGDHWVPVSPDRRMTARDRSSPNGPVIMAELIAEVEGERIVGWRKIGSLFQDVGPDGEVQPLDTRLPAAIMGARLADGALNAPGVIGINTRIVERRRAREERRIPAHLHASALARAETQILDRLNGFRSVGVRLIPISSDDTSV